jgi:hypothetical protein
VKVEESRLFKLHALVPSPKSTKNSVMHVWIDSNESTFQMAHSICQFACSKIGPFIGLHV